MFPFRPILIVKWLPHITERKAASPHKSQPWVTLLPKGASKRTLPSHCQYLRAAGAPPSFLFPRLSILGSSPVYHVTSFPICLIYLKSYKIPSNLGFSLELLLICGDFWNHTVFIKQITNIQLNIWAHFSSVPQSQL